MVGAQEELAALADERRRRRRLRCRRHSAADCETRRASRGFFPPLPSSLFSLLLSHSLFSFDDELALQVLERPSSEWALVHVVDDVSRKGLVPASHLVFPGEWRLPLPSPPFPSLFHRRYRSGRRWKRGSREDPHEDERVEGVVGRGKAARELCTHTLVAAAAARVLAAAGWR